MRGTNCVSLTNIDEVHLSFVTLSHNLRAKNLSPYKTYRLCTCTSVMGYLWRGYENHITGAIHRPNSVKVVYNRYKIQIAHKLKGIQSLFTFVHSCLFCTCILFSYSFNVWNAIFIDYPHCELAKMHYLAP